MMKHKQVLANLAEFKLTEFQEIDSPISALQDKTIRQLIMDLKTVDGETIFIAVERNWQGEQVAWAKRKYSAEAEVYSSHMAAWLVKLHGECITAKLDPDVQQIVKTVEWRENVPLYPEEAEVEDASKMTIDWLIDISEIRTSTVDDKSITMDDVSIGSFGDQSFFSATQSQHQDASNYNEIHSPPTLHEQDDSSRNTTVTFAQCSQGVERYGMPSALS